MTDNKITKLYGHRLIGPNLDSGLGGSQFVDHLIGVVEGAYQIAPTDPVLEEGLKALEDAFPKYFRVAVGNQNKGQRQKPAGYRASQGF